MIVRESINWDRNDPYGYLGIGNPFRRIKKGDVINTKGTTVYTPGRIVFANTKIIVFDHEIKGDYLEIKGIFNPRLLPLPLSKRDYEKLLLAGEENPERYLLSLNIELDEWLKNFSIIPKEEFV